MSHLGWKLIPHNFIKTMTDRLTREQRHRTMAAIHGKNTKPEMVVRRYLFSRGFRYRTNYPRLPGHPDIVLRKYRTVIFVNGCFWHGHEGCRYYVQPHTNTAFWKNKIEKNRQRDTVVQKALARMGWHCITIWECQLKQKTRARTLESLAYTLNHIYLMDREIQSPTPAESYAAVAEPPTPYGH